jgi:Tfp pilus assembly protein PilN
VRPVNLTPPEDRRGDRSGAREGAVAYGIVGALAVILVAVTAMVLTSNSISDKEAELASAQAREQAARAKAESLAPYSQFASLAQSRDQTVASLATSRFDWERVLRELALVIPDNVWLTSTTGTVSPAVSVEGSTGNPLRSQAQGPALELVGCGDGQESVAAFVAALKDIDGVTRVGLNSSELPTTDVSTDGGGSGDDCRTRNFIARFEIVIAFDAVPAPAAPTATGEATPAAASSTEAVPGADETAAAQEQAADSAAQQTERAKNATEIVPGGEEK